MSKNEADPRGHAVILAAGRGTRMRSRLGKVLHPVLGRPMVAWPTEAAHAAGLGVVLVVNHQEDAVRAAMAHSGVSFARQEVPRGTGDAVASAMDALPSAGMVVILNGDGPLIRPGTISRLLDAHASSGAVLTVVSMVVEEPGRYGRIVRTAEGGAAEIVEADHASVEQLAIHEVNTGLYAIDIAWLRSALPRLQPHPPKGEVYLTDCVALAAAEGRARVMVLADPEEALGVNTQVERAQAARILQDRIVLAHMQEGVAFEDPRSVTVEPSVVLAADARIERGVVLRGNSSVGVDSIIGAYSVLTDAEIADGARVLAHSVVEGARVGSGSVVGPHARLRPGTVIGEGCKVGNFVETKKAVLEDGAKVSHLSYIGDARVGAGANVGAGTITCNYDGFSKAQTEIGAGAFVGSNTALVAPVVVGKGAIVGAGSVIVRDVPADAVAVARGTQSHRDGAATRFRSQRSKRNAKD